MTPARTEQQTVWSSRVTIEPAAWSFSYIDYWGTEVTTFEVHVTRSGQVGSVVRYRFARAGRRPVQQSLCLAPGASKPGRC